MNYRGTVVVVGVAVLAGAIAIGCGGGGDSGTTGATSGGGASGGGEGGTSSATTGTMTASGTGGTGGGTTSTTTTSTTTSTTSTTTSSTGTGTTGQDCDAFATAICTELKTCAPAVFALAYESDTICKAETAKGCNNGQMLDGVTGINDPAACLTALTSSCQAFFDSAKPTPDACKPTPGTKGTSMNDACTSSSQCQSLYCYISTTTKPGCPGYCDTPFTVGTDCQGNDTLCDALNGEHCLKTFDAMNGTTTAPATCQAVEYGLAGADCFAGTAKQCATGFACGTSKKCIALQKENAPCSASVACDSSLGLVCLSNGTQNVCTLPIVVQIGAQCGLVAGKTQVCSAFAVCKGTPSTCTAKVMEGQPCTVTPSDNCYPGLTCKTGTCQAPAPITCP